VSHVVRGEDLADNTARQIHLQRLLGLPTPHYLHTPLVLGPNGEKLSKQNGAEALELHEPLPAIVAAGAVLGIHCHAADLHGWLTEATARWRHQWHVAVA
jgi:glutamyl-Q tRNA(Asp) synthetase